MIEEAEAGVKYICSNICLGRWFQSLDSQTVRNVKLKKTIDFARGKFGRGRGYKSEKEVII